MSNDKSDTKCVLFSRITELVFGKSKTDLALAIEQLKAEALRKDKALAGVHKRMGELESIIHYHKVREEMLARRAQEAEDTLGPTKQALQQLTADNSKRLRKEARERNRNK